MVRLPETLLTLALLGTAACWGGPVAPGHMHSVLEGPAAAHDALALSDALEQLISEGKDTKADRHYAYDEVRKFEQRTAAYAFARAAITGRVVQARGLAAAQLVEEVERYALKSRELDPNFRDGAATRMLGTLYVLAPAALLEHGDSEQGIELLEGLVRKRPNVLENHLRLAEAYIALNNPEPAIAHLCLCVTNRSSLRGDERALLDRLLKDAEDPRCGPPPPPAAPAKPAASH